jgi:hypothetical protein
VPGVLADLLMDEPKKKSFDFAQETTKQLLTLATGVLALTITFRKDIVEDASSGAETWLQAGWILFLVSAVAGIATLGALSGNLDKQANPTIYAGNIRAPSLVQLMTFGAAVVCTFVFGVKAL